MLVCGLCHDGPDLVGADDTGPVEACGGFRVLSVDAGLGVAGFRAERHACGPGAGQ